MVAFFGLFQIIEVFLQFFLVIKGCTIQPLQHRVMFITSPVCPGNLDQFKDLQPAAVRYVGAAAQVKKIAQLVQTDLIAFNFLEKFNLILFALLFKKGYCLCLRYVISYKRKPVSGCFLHFGLNGFKIFGCKWCFSVKIIIKAIFNSRSDCNFQIGTI